MPKRVGLIDLLGILTILVLCLRQASPVGDPGIGWHLMSGRWMFENLAVPRIDPFLSTSQNTAWVHDQWLSDVLLWSLYRLGGFPALTVLVIALSLVLHIGILGPMFRSQLGSSIAGFAMVLLVLSATSVQWFLRPVLFAFVFFAILLALLSDSLLSTNPRMTKRHFLVFCFLFLLWCNMHPSFVLGLIIVTITCAASLLFPTTKVRQQIPAINQILFCCAVFGITLLNPYGASLHATILELGQNSYFMNLNNEWLSPSFYDFLFISLPIFLMLFLGSILSWGKSRYALPDVILGALFCYSALMHRRYLPFFGILAAWSFCRAIHAAGGIRYRSNAKLLRGALGKALSRIAGKESVSSTGQYSALGFSFLLVFTLVAGHLPGKTTESSGFIAGYPRTTVEYLSRQTPTGPIFHTPDWGGYLTWQLFPVKSAFIDDRNQINPEARYEDFFTLNLLRAKSDQVLARYGFSWLLLEAGSPLELKVVKNPDWTERARDVYSVLYEKSGSGF